MVIQPLARRNHTATLTAPRAAPLRSCLPPRGLAVSPPLVPLSRVGGCEPAAHEIRAFARFRRESRPSS